MIHLKTRTECSFGVAAGQMKDVLSCLPGTHAAITDRHGTWGHVRWASECKDAGKIPLFGVELVCVTDMETREKQMSSLITLIARTNKGLSELYQLTTLATEKFYYTPRIDWGLLNEISNDIIILTGANSDWTRLPKKKKNIFVELDQLSAHDAPAKAKEFGYKCVATCDNIFPRPTDLPLYEVIMGKNRVSRTVPGHILSEWEWRQFWPDQTQAIHVAEKLALECKVSLPKAELVHPKVSKTIHQMCIEGAKYRKINLKDKVYAARLERELNLIKEKKFEDYFYVVQDMIAWAKERMLVGPARGSSCGSLVCYLLGITDIDPIPYHLLFERFIDINREDYPDIDIDFQDDKRELVFDYLREKYGHDQVTRLGTINFFKAKSALGVCAKELQVPAWEILDLKNSMIERSSGDSRAAFCILDTFDQSEIGKRTIAKYPELVISARMEGCASHTGMHAAGILITSQPIVNYCAVNVQTGTAMLDKKDAEKLEMLKIDALGLRTLSVIQDTLSQIGWTREQLRDYRTDDVKAFDVLNNRHFAGIFQFEGYALQSLCKQLPIETFEDIVSLTALARPGPLDSGGATEFLKRRTNKAPVVYLHPQAEEITKVTYGVIVYQEQVMQIARVIGALSWEDVSQLRKAMSKSMGKEFFDGYFEKFRDGAKAKHNIKEEDARIIWDNINTMGAWAFNRSHAVAYGMMSYWCLILKAHFPLEFAASCLRNAKDDEQSIKILRELSMEGYSYKPYCAKTSKANWSVQNGVLVGGLTAIKGVGDKLAESILRKRDAGIAFTPREQKLLEEGKTPWDMVFECADLWGHVIKNPAAYGIESNLVQLQDITLESQGTFVFIAKITEKDLRDHNELSAVQKRGGRKITGLTTFLNLTLEDDTTNIIATVNRFNFAQYGAPIVDNGKIGDWYLWKGENRHGFRKIYVQRWKKLSGNEEFTTKQKFLKKSVSKIAEVDDTLVTSNKRAIQKPKTKQTKSKTLK